MGLNALSDDLLDRLGSLGRAGRRLVAVAGAPGSGKSTLTAELCERLNARTPGLAEVVPMDGFHYDDAVLKARGTHPRKGAPFTFDVGGLRSLILRLKANAEDEIAVPVFDRDLEISRAGGRLVSRATPLILVEGNYLLLNEAPWAELKPLFDLTIMLEVPFDEIERRIVARWIGHGFAPEAARTRASSNDLPNAELVVKHSAAADIVITNA